MGVKLLRTYCIALIGAQPALLAAAVPVLMDAPAAIAQAQSAKAVGKVAQAITVRIEGATQGSGVLVKRDGNRYTVLTAWHVVSGQRPGEELDIYTPDGQRHQLEQGSIKRLGEVDLAVLTFSSSYSYELVLTGDAKSVSSGSNVYVSGFPLPTDAVPTRIFRFLKGYVIANSTSPMPNGYQLLYENKSLPGMSGGAVLDDQGQLIGIHGAGETDIGMSEQKGVAVKTGHNQAVPIAYYEKHYSDISEDAPVATTSRQQITTEMSKSAEKYFNSGNIKFVTGDERGAIADFGRAIAIDPQYAVAYKNRGRSKLDLGDEEGAIADFDRAIAINPLLGDAFFHRSLAKRTRDRYGACQDMRQSELLGSSFAKNYIPEVCQ